MARYLRQVTLNGLLHVHFTGAGGNIGAGKYNDGTPENRQILAQRLANGMAAAWIATARQPIRSTDVTWRTQAVVLPPAPHLDEKQLLTVLDDDNAHQYATRLRSDRPRLAPTLQESGRCPSQLSAPGEARILLLPGEAVVEYQLWAQQENPEEFVAVAAYGDYATGYICLEARTTPRVATKPARAHQESHPVRKPC